MALCEDQALDKYLALQNNVTRQQKKRQSNHGSQHADKFRKGGLLISEIVKPEEQTGNDKNFQDLKFKIDIYTVTTLPFFKTKTDNMYYYPPSARAPKRKNDTSPEKRKLIEGASWRQLQIHRPSTACEIGGSLESHVALDNSVPNPVSQRYSGQSLIRLQDTYM